MVLPLVSIIIPTLNQGKFIGETLDSIFSQDYPNIEVIVMDGGSKDETIQILKAEGRRQKAEKNGIKFFWKSEKDKGQADAINKGLRLATGDILCYLNSDDYLLSDAISTVVDEFQKNKNIMVVTGDGRIVDENGNQIQQPIRWYKRLFRMFPLSCILPILNPIVQPSTFWRKEAIRAIGFFDEKLRYTFDYDYWMRMKKVYFWSMVSKPLSCFRIHQASKGGGEYKKQFEEELSVLSRYEKNSIIYLLHAFHNACIVWVYSMIKTQDTWRVWKQLYWLFIIVMLFLSVFAIPPFQKPDEPLHFKRAFSLVSGQVFCMKDAMHTRGYFSYPKTAETFPETVFTSSILMNYEKKFPWRSLVGPYPIGNMNEKQELMYNCTLPFMGYIPQTLGVFFSLPFDNLLVSFFMGRLFSAFLFLLCVFIAFRLIPARYRLIIYVYTSIPMVLFQASAFSYDSVSLSVGLLVWSMFTKFMEEKTMSIRWFFLFYMVLVWWIMSKPGWYPWFVLPYILWSKVSLSILPKIGVFGGMTVLSLFITWFLMTMPI